MPLSLTITRAKGGGGRQTRTLTEGTLSIGRAAGNDWVLADPDQHLSRTHCMIGFEDGHYWLTDCSTNGMLVNGARQPTARDSRMVLTDGDTILLGGYVLEVAEVAGRDNAAGRRDDPFARSGQQGDPLDVDPLDDPLGPSGFAHPLPPPPPLQRIEDPFDRAEQQGRPAGRGEDQFRGLTPLDSWAGPSQPDNVDAIAEAIGPQRAFQPVNVDEIDFDALLGDIMPTPNAHPLDPPKPETTRPKAAVSHDDLDDLLGDFPLEAGPGTGSPPPVVPRVAPVVPEMVAPVVPKVAPPVAPVVPETVTPADRPAAATPALLAAFLEGAGIARLDVTGADQEAAMHAVGALFRALVGGTRDVLMSRAEIKHEMRVEEQTMIRSRDNNALKFSVSTEDALEALLRPSRPGYKPPLAAVEEAFRDILSHEMAVMAGMQTGLIALLKRFDPAGLEGRLQRGMLDSIMPGARKARFWELFCTTYKDIARDAEDDFHAVFGRDFARAYDAQVKKL